MKKVFTSLIAAAVTITSASALDLTFRLSPGVLLPSDSDKYETGFSGFLQADADLFGFLTAGIEGQFGTVKPSGLEDSMTLAGAGIGLGAYYSPLSRLYLGAGGALGVYSFSTKIENKTESASDLYWRGYGEVGFRVTPEFTVAATGGYANYMVKGESPLINGFTAGVTLRYTISTSGKSSSSFGLSFEQEDSAFPVFMTAYRNCPVGTLTLRNNEPSEIRNIHVSFRAGKYTASTYESARISSLMKHSSQEIQLLADFSPEILKYSENGKISGEIVVDYELLGKKKQSIQNVVIDMYNRNAFYWSDPAALAAFVSSETPEVLQLASIISGIETNNLIPGMNKNFQMAAAMFEGLRISGIKYSGDKTTPYLEYHKSENLDSIQYPLQTMNYLSGDYDDIGVLLMSCLESVGVPTGYMILDDDFLVLVGMKARAGTEQNHFASPEGVIADEDDVYFGLSMVNFEKGFIASRKAASNKIAAIRKNPESQFDYAGTHAAWEIYPSSVFSGSGGAFDYPSKAAIEKNTKEAVADYVSTDLGTVIVRAQKSGDSNKVGVAYLRSGRITEAKAEFQKSNSISAMNNLANCLMIEKNYSAAASQYRKVLARDSQNKIATRGLDAATEKLGQ